MLLGALRRPSTVCSPCRKSFEFRCNATNRGLVSTAVVATRKTVVEGREEKFPYPRRSEESTVFECRCYAVRLPLPFPSEGPHPRVFVDNARVRIFPTSRLVHAFRGVSFFSCRQTAAVTCATATWCNFPALISHTIVLARSSWARVNSTTHVSFASF